jgi:hypothetical protein
MDFYKFWQILDGNKNEWAHGVRRFPERPDTPPDLPTWEDKDLRWSDWEEDGTNLRLVDGHFFDFRNRPLPFLDEYAPQAQNWNQTHGIYLNYQKMYGTLPGSDDPRGGESWDDQDVRVELEKPALSDPSNPENRIDLPERLTTKIKSHFFPGYE